MRHSFIVLFFEFLVALHVEAFLIPTTSTLRNECRTSFLASSASDTSSTGRRMGELTNPEQQVYSIMKELHDSGYSFRVVVVGRGAILESTTILGPVLSLAQSPSSGKNLVTLASKDKSFEYHLQLADASKIVLINKETPNKIMRLIRILNANGETMSSLILADDSDAASEWFKDLGEKYGTDIQL